MWLREDHLKDGPAISSVPHMSCNGGWPQRPNAAPVERSPRSQVDRSGGPVFQHPREAGRQKRGRGLFFSAEPDTHRAFVHPATSPISVTGKSRERKLRKIHCAIMEFGKRIAKNQTAATTDRRAARRSPADLRAELLIPGRPSRECRVIDLSTSGARLMCPSSFGIPLTFEIRIQNKTFTARIVHRSSRTISVKFR
jgi:hypothetical protein